MFGTNFWEEIAGGVAKQWADRVFSPALLFWMGGLLAYATAHGWCQVYNAVDTINSHLQVVLAVFALVLVAGSALAIEGLQLIALRLMEGYWPRFLEQLRRRRIDWIKNRLQKKQDEWDRLVTRYKTLTDSEREIYARLDGELATHPAPGRLLPTRLGNLLRAAEDYSWRRYGLATAVVWARLWLVIPEEAREEIGQARDRLDGAVRLYLWSILSLIWAVWAWWWVVPTAALGIIFSYLRALKAAGIYGELIRASFDLYRVGVYKSLRWPLPGDPAEEYEMGKRLTDYLWRGSHQKTPKFSKDWL
jgi:hypothetical protein